MKLFFFPLVATTLLLAGCDQYTGPTQVSGTVQDAHTRQPVPHAIVQVLGASTSASSTSPGGVVQATADVQGRYSLSFEARAHEVYQLQAFSASGYTPLTTPYVDGGRKTENLAVYASAPAWVKINCVDDPPASRVGLNLSGYDNVGYNQYVGPGDYSFIRPTQSYFSGVVLWRTTSADAQAQVKEGRESYTTAGLDTATVTIHF